LAWGQVSQFWFQSAPGGEAGGNPINSAVRPRRAEFQSAPGGEAGGNLPAGASTRPDHGFNPPPAVRPGETGIRIVYHPQFKVSIRPRR